MPQQLETKVEYINEATDEVYLRSFGLKDGVVAGNDRFSWMSHSSKNDINSFVEADVIQTPWFDHIVVTDSYEAWKSAQQPFVIGKIKFVVPNLKTGAYDFIWKVTNPQAAVAAKKGYYSKLRVSPAIWGDQPKQDDDGIVHYNSYKGVHMVVVKHGAFGDELARINDHVCVGGGGRCKEVLAAVASRSQEAVEGRFNPPNYNFDPLADIEKNFTFDIDPTDSNSHSSMSTNDKTVSYEEHYKLKDLLATSESKLKDALELNKTVTDNESKTKTRLSEVEKELNERKEKDKRAEFSEFFKVVYGAEDETKVKTAVDQAIQRKYERKDLDDLYGPLYEQKKKELDEKAKAEQEGNIDNSGTRGSSDISQEQKAGVGSASQAFNAAIAERKNNRESAEIALGLVRMRRS